MAILSIFPLSFDIFYSKFLLNRIMYNIIPPKLSIMQDFHFSLYMAFLYSSSLILMKWTVCPLFSFTHLYEILNIEFFIKFFYLGGPTLVWMLPSTVERLKPNLVLSFGFVRPRFLRYNNYNHIFDVSWGHTTILHLRNNIKRIYLLY